MLTFLLLIYILYALMILANFAALKAFWHKYIYIFLVTFLDKLVGFLIPNIN
jgi:hypothetical protein